MGNSVLPTLSGVRFSVLRKPRAGATLIQTATSGKETRVALWSSPINDFELSYEFLWQNQPYQTIGEVPAPAAIRSFGTPIIADDWAALEGFFKARQGAFDDFLFNDVYTPDNAAQNMQFAVGDGQTAAFQLTRMLGTFVEPLQNIAGVLTSGIDAPPVIFIDAAPQPSSAYAISATGVVTFNTPPASGAILAWSGGFYWRVRFAQDVNEFELFMHNFFRLQKLELTGIKL